MLYHAYREDYDEQFQTWNGKVLAIGTSEGLKWAINGKVDAVMDLCRRKRLTVKVRQSAHSRTSYEVLSKGSVTIVSVYEYYKQTKLAQAPVQSVSPVDGGPHTEIESAGA